LNKTDSSAISYQLSAISLKALFVAADGCALSADDGCIEVRISEHS